MSQVGPNGAHCYHNFSYRCSSQRLSLESPPDYYRHYDNRDDHHADSDRDRHNYADDDRRGDYLGVSGCREIMRGRRAEGAGRVIGFILSPVRFYFDRTFAWYFCLILLPGTFACYFCPVLFSFYRTLQREFRVLEHVWRVNWGDWHCFGNPHLTYSRSDLILGEICLKLS